MSGKESYKTPDAQNGPPTKINNSKQNLNTLQRDEPDLQCPESLVWRARKKEEEERARNIEFFFTLV